MAGEIAVETGAAGGRSLSGSGRPGPGSGAADPTGLGTMAAEGKETVGRRPEYLLEMALGADIALVAARAPTISATSSIRLRRGTSTR